MLAAAVLLASLVSAPPVSDEGATLRIPLWHSTKGDAYIVCPDDAQAARKLAQGNHWACAINTRGTTHMAGAVKLNGRVYLVDNVKPWLERGALLPGDPRWKEPAHAHR